MGRVINDKWHPLPHQTGQAVRRELRQESHQASKHALLISNASRLTATIDTGDKDGNYYLLT